MFDFTKVNLAENLVNILFAIIQACIIVVVTERALNRVFLKERNMGKSLRQCGIEKISASKGVLTARDREKLFGLNGNLVPSEINLCFITGNIFFRDFQEKKHYIQELAKRGCKVKILLANPLSGKITANSNQNGIIKDKIENVVDYYYKIYSGKEEASSFLEREYVMLISSALDEKSESEARNELAKRLIEHADHNGQVKRIEAMLKEARKHSAQGGDIELHYYTDEYQMPIILAKYNATNKRDSKVVLWTNINAPIKATIESINIYAEKNINESRDFVTDVENSFNYLLRKYSRNELEEN